MKKKILFLMPSLVGGGAERTLVNLLQQIDYTLYEITVVTVLRKGIYIDQIPKVVDQIFLFKSELILKLLTKLHQRINFPYILSWAFKKKVTGNFDVGISFLDCVYTELLHSTPMIKRKIAWVHASYISYHNFYKFYKRPSYRNRVLKTRYNQLDSIVFVSNDARTEFIELFGEFNSMPVIYNPINKSIVIEKSLEDINLDQFRNSFNFIAVGSLIPVKNYDLLIEAANDLIHKFSDFKIFILGSGSLEAALKTKVQLLGLNDNIKFLGFVSNPYPYIKNSDVFVMTSMTEALPTALCEAMILGKPVIVTNVSGCKEIVNNGEFGLLSDLNSKNLSKNMLDLIYNSDKYDFYANQSRVRAQIFKDSEFLSQFYKLIEQ